MKSVALLLAIVAAAVIAACSTAPAQTVTGTVTFSWTAPTTNTDGSAITGVLTYDIYDVTSNPSAASGGALVANGVSGSSYVLTAVADGNHCYTIAAVEAFPDGTLSNSAYAAPSVCTTVTNAAPATPNPPTAVGATAN